MAVERLFFALWPDEGVRKRLGQYLAELTKGIDGRRVADKNWHITLSFLGPTVAEKRQIAEELAARVQAEPFQLELNQAACWRRPKVAWVGASRVPGSLTYLLSQLTQALERQGFPVDKRPFVPHLTVMRKVRCPTADLPQPQPITWLVDRFVLVRSRTLTTGAEYDVVGEWVLQ